MIAAWRAEELPLLCVGRASRSGGETISPFDEAALERTLDALGTTAVVLCGAGPALAWAAETAAGLGCHVFVPVDACSQGDLAPIAAAEAQSRGDRARLTDVAAVLAAASLAKARLKALSGSA